MSLSSYLASKYLTAEPSPSSSGSKKRKRKTPSSSSGLIIADDDNLGWSNSRTDKNDDDDSPLVASAPGSSSFRKSKKNAWKVVGAPAPKDSDLDAATADAIIASTASENAAAAHLDEAPAIADDDRNIVRMSDGTHAGLQTAASVAAQLAARKKAETEAWEAEERIHGKDKRGKEETVYRDATGRRIDISMARASARAEADAKLVKEKQEKEEQLGDVQRAAKARRKEELEEAKFLPLARTIDDEDLNRELKQRIRWDDPAAQFLSRDKLDHQARGGGDDAGGGNTGRGGKPVYKGAAPPNRYGIRPGYRWDGVDRGNGWESERFKAINRRERNKGLDFAWQMDE